MAWSGHSSSTSLPPSSATSVSVAEYTENGRTYQGYRKGTYIFPCDEAEIDRMDVYHKILEVARNHLHRIPSEFNNPQDPARIVDLGCGTGIWAIDMAIKHPNAEVIGMDLANIQPKLIPNNLKLLVPRDYEGIWALGENSLDFVHAQMQAGAVENWPALYRKILEHLKPGCGFYEQVEIDLKPRCDDGTLPENSQSEQWYGYMVDSTQRNLRNIEYNHASREQLRQAGFVDIEEQIIPLPLNSWPTDKKQKALGAWYNLGFTLGVEALSLGPLYRMYGWNPTSDIIPLCQRVREEVSQTHIHLYNNLHIITARKP